MVSSGVAFAGGVVNPVHLDLPRVGYGLGLLRWLANLLALFTCLVMHLELLVYAVLNTQSQRMSRSDMDTLAANTAFPVASAVVFLALLLDTCFLACVACCDRRRRQALPGPPRWAPRRHDNAGELLGLGNTARVCVRGCRCP